jgi:predicted transcriptional regulator
MLYACKRRIAMAKRRLAALSPAETEMLRIVWETGKATVQDVVDRLPARRKITYATVQTLLRRLENKGYLKHDNRGKAHVFYAAVRSQEVIRRTVGDFVDRLFGGDPIGLMQYLAEHGKIDPDDIENLKELIDKNNR